jgi:DNA invertase Pin-like site-specific DNA recombinase
MSVEMKHAKNTNSAQPVVISYLRFSRPEQLKGDSIRRQLALGEEWAGRHKMKIADTFRDQGVSAFRGKNAEEGSLARLLGLIDSGSIPRGSVLLVEQLDRLSRNAVLEALELFLSIIRRGIKVVTLMDGQEYDKDSLSRNMMQLQYSIMMMSLAHEESAKKSERLSHAWNAKRSRIGDRILTRQMPAWLKEEGGKIIIDKEKATVIRQMVKLVMDGYGMTAITKKLNEEFDGLARVNYFQRSYVTKIAHNRALLGEFQPHKVTYEGGKRVRRPIGEPVIGYFPALIDEQTFYAMQQRLASRRRTGGRTGKFVNLFVGLIFDAKDRSPMQITDKGGGRRYVSSAAMLGRKGASPYVGVPVSVVERGILLQLHDMVLPKLGGDAGRDDLQVQVEAFDGRIAEVDKKIAATQEMMMADAAINTASVVSMLTKLDANKKRLVEQRDDLRRELASRSDADIDIAREQLAKVVTYYKRGQITLTEDERIGLRNVMKLVVERIDLDVKREPKGFTIVPTVTLKGGDVVKFSMFVIRQDRMLRNEKGHPIPGGAKGEPDFKIRLADFRWAVVSPIRPRNGTLNECSKGVPEITLVLGRGKPGSGDGVVGGCNKILPRIEVIPVKVKPARAPR